MKRPLIAICAATLLGFANDALAYARYDYRFEFGQGFHNNRHGRAMLPDTLRWLWRGYQP